MITERKRVVYRYPMVVKATAEDIFPLLCPVAEYDWISHWQCDVLYTGSGKAELGCVFATDFDDGYGREVWVVYHYEPLKKIAFVRGGEKRTMRYEISLAEEGGQTSLLWQQEVTALDDAGDALIQNKGEQRFSSQMALLEKQLCHYLEYGKALNLHSMDLKTGE